MNRSHTTLVKIVWAPCRRRRKRAKTVKVSSPLHQRRHDPDLAAAPPPCLTLAAGESWEMELARILRSCLSPAAPQFRPQSLHDLCIRTAAVYATTSLYEFHDKRCDHSPCKIVDYFIKTLPKMARSVKSYTFLLVKTVTSGRVGRCRNSPSK